MTTTVSAAVTAEEADIARRVDGLVAANPPGRTDRRALRLHLASTAAPFFLGAAAGAAASGQLAVTPDGGFTGNALLDWIRPMSIHRATVMKVY